MQNMSLSFEQVRDAISRGRNQRASLIISDLEKNGLPKVAENSNINPAKILLGKKYNAKSFHESEKLYTQEKLNQLTKKAISEGDFNSYQRLSRMYEASQKDSKSFNDSVEFSRSVHKITENAKFMPLNSALSPQALAKMEIMKEDKANVSSQLFDLPTDAIVKGFYSQTLSMINDFKNVGAAAGYASSRLLQSEKGKKLFENLSNKNLDVFQDDPDAGSYSFMAGRIAPLLVSVIASSGAGVAGVASSFSKEFAKAFSKQLAINSAKAASVLGISSLAGEAAKIAAESLEMHEVNVRGLESTARLGAMRAMHNYFITPSENQLASERISEGYDNIVNEVVNDLDAFAKDRKNHFKQFFTDTLGELLPAREGAKFQTSIKPSSIGLPEFQDVATGSMKTINDLTGYSSKIQTSGMLKTNPLPEAKEYSHFASASLTNAMVDEVKSQGTKMVPELAGSDIELFQKSIDADRLNQFSLGAISRNANEINIPALLKTDEGIELYKIKQLVEKYGKVSFSDYDNMARKAELQSVFSNMGLDKNLTNRFLGSFENPELPVELSAEEKGQLAVSAQKIAKKLFELNKGRVYKKFNPILDQFDNKEEEYVSSKRKDVLKKFDEALVNPDLRNAWEEIASIGGKDTSIYFSDDSNGLQVSGSFPNLVRGLLQGYLNDGRSISFYQGLKQARSILSRNNPYRYRAPVPQSAYTNPKTAPFAYIRNNIIDSLYEGMQSAKNSMMTPEEITEYNEGEALFKNIKEEEEKAIEAIMQYDFRRKGNNPEKLFAEFYRKPQILRYLQKVGGMEFTPLDLNQFMSIMKGSPIEEWEALKASKTVDYESSPYTALHSALVLESLSGMIRARGGRTFESFANLKSNVNAPADLRGSKLNELLNAEQLKAFNQIISSDVRNKNIRLSANRDQFYAQTMQQNIFSPNKSKTAKAVIKLIIKKTGFLKPLGVILMSILKDYEQDSRLENIAKYSAEIKKVLQNSLIIKDALKNKIEGLE